MRGYVALALAFFALTMGAVIAQEVRKPDNLRSRTTRIYRVNPENTNEDALEQVISEEFNGQGDLTRWSKGTGEDAEVKKYENSYDGKNRLTEAKELASDGRLTKKVANKYGEDGSRTETTESYSGDKGKEKTYLVDTSEYNKAGKLVTDACKEVVANVEGRRTYKYDAAGHLESMTQVYNGKTVNYTYKTDARGNMIERIRLGDDGKPVRKENWRANEKNDCVEYWDYNGAGVLRIRVTQDYAYKDGNTTGMKVFAYFGGSDKPGGAGRVEYEYEFYKEK